MPTMKPSVLLLCAAVLLSSVPAEAQRGRTPRCRTVPRDAQPTARERADSANFALRYAVADSIRTQVAAAARQAGIEEPAGLVVVVRGRGRPEIHRHESNVAETIIREVLVRRATLLGSLPEGFSTFHFRLDRLPAAPASPDTTTRVECRPEVANEDRFSREVMAIGQREQPGPGATMSPTAVHLRMLVSREGEVAYVTLERRSGRPAADRMVIDAARRLRFEPATLNGRPRDTWVDLPVHLHLDVGGGSTPRRP